MTVEMNAGSRRPALATGDDIDARISAIVSRRPLGPHIGDVESAPLESPADEFCARPVGLPGRIHRAKANQVARQVHEFVAALVDGLEYAVGDIGTHGFS